MSLPGGKCPCHFQATALDVFVAKCQKLCTSSSAQGRAPCGMSHNYARRVSAWPCGSCHTRLNLQFVAQSVKSLFIITNLHKKLCNCRSTFRMPKATWPHNECICCRPVSVLLLLQLLLFCCLWHLSALNFDFACWYNVPQFIAIRLGACEHHALSLVWLLYLALAYCSYATFPISCRLKIC